MLSEIKDFEMELRKEFDDFMNDMYYHLFFSDNKEESGMKIVDKIKQMTVWRINGDKVRW